MGMAGVGGYDVDYVVVGAGLTGIRAARELASAGASVRVLEARDGVGGRVLTAPDQTGLVLDLGAQWVGPGQDEILNLIHELGMSTVSTAVPGRATWATEAGVRTGRASLPPAAPTVLADVLASVGRLGVMCRQVPVDAPWRARMAARWDAMTLEDWIRRRVHTHEGRALLGMFVRGNLAIEPHQISLLGLLYDLHSAGSISGLVRAETLRLQEGAQELAIRLAQPVQERIRFSDAVRAVTQDDGGVTVESDAGVQRCRRAALCLPPLLARRLRYTPDLPRERRELLDRLFMASSIKFHAVYERPFWRSGGLSGQALSTVHPVTVVYDNSPADETGRGVLVGLIVADHARRLGGLDRTEQERPILSSLEDFFGPTAATPGQLVIQDWGQEEWTQGCFAANFAPNLWTTFGPAVRQPFGRLHWASTETSPEWNGYMEGALRAGKRVADELLRSEYMNPGAIQRGGMST